jgi:hypothetical protein
MFGNLTQQGMFGIVCAVLGIAAGIYFSRTIRKRMGERKPSTKPPVYASRQDMRKAEREKAKKYGR